ncbi:flagellar biosynthetic protein FliQ [Aquitalea aquatica]|uniref:Flagellar biosynthetic protein FliQ n=1 Tax=Aquitalea aquatica TaxID=3044273 RepID=A0A838Y7R8_9NEIS|nr:flagellar biosynthetic protein FliQ [Aquitalea magnusonii]MBA4707085.1 flagellar biosynthetic protein FliQ [Aquitalea magnusonii]
MTSDLSLQLMSQMAWMALAISGPILFFSLAIGILVSVIQVVTQIQDASLAFIPKLLAVFVAFLLFGPWMLKSLVNYASSVIGSIPSLF